MSSDLKINPERWYKCQGCEQIEKDSFVGCEERAKTVIVIDEQKILDMIIEAKTGLDKLENNAIAMMSGDVTAMSAVINILQNLLPDN